MKEIYNLTQVLIFITCCCVSSTSHAQQRPFGGNNAIWHFYDVEFGPERGILTVNLEGDTLIGDRNCQIIEKHLNTLNYQTYQTSEETLKPDFVNQKEEVAELYNPVTMSFDTLFDFSAHPGDSWSIRDHDTSQYFDVIIREVLDTFRYSIGGETRRALVIRDSSTNNNQALLAPDTVVYGIGSINFYFHPWAYFLGALDGETEADELRCYSENGEVLLKRGDEECDQLPDPIISGIETTSWTYDHFGHAWQGIIKLSKRPDFENPLGDQLTPIVFDYTVNDRTQDSVIEYQSESSIFLQKKNNLVLYYHPDSITNDTLYNFGAPPGLEWQIDLPGIKQAIHCEVVDTGTLELEGHFYKAWAMKYTAQYIDPGASYLDTVVEGVGNLRQFLLPWDYFEAFVDGQLGGTLRCFNDAEISWKRADIEFCVPETLRTSVKDSRAQPFLVFPNPTSEFLTFELGNELRSMKYNLISSLGLIRSGSVTDQSLDVRDLVPGIYFLQLKSPTGWKGITRFLKVD